jgi:orotate phosphoribosyltransferase
VLPAHLPIRDGHFLLESGLHARMWIDLDALFVDVRRIAQSIDALARLLAPATPTAMCGPLLGGAFLAQALAARMGLPCFCAERVAPSGDSTQSDGLFRAAYRVPKGQRALLAGHRVALVDDVVSAGSSVRAAAADLETCGARVVIVGALMTLGDVGVAHFAARGIDVVAPECRAFETWVPAQCPLCAAGAPLEAPE